MTVEELVQISEQNGLTVEQVVYMHHLQNSLECNIKLSDFDMGELRVRQYIVKGKVTSTWTSVVQKRTDRPISIILNADLLPVLHHISTILIQHKPGTQTLKNIDNNFINNEGLSELYYTWMCLFPTEGEENNAGWEDLFECAYDGVRLRKFVPKHANNFKKQARKKDIDIGIYILGTYLFIRSNIRDGRPFIPGIDKFIDIQDEWYDTAEEYMNVHGAEGFYKLVDAGTTVRFYPHILPVYDALYKQVSPVIPEKTIERLGKAFQGDVAVMNAFVTWFGLFPSGEPSEDGPWKNLFGVEYQGTAIRVLTDQVINSMKALMRKEEFDMGSFIIGTYLYIRAHIKDGKAFIPSIDKFFSASEQYYQMAVEKTASASTQEVYAMFNRDIPVGIKEGQGASMI